MLKLVKQHLKSCPHRSKGREWKRCSCPVWIEGRKDGLRIQRTLDTANWEIAADRLLEFEANDAKVDVTPSEAIKQFYADCRSRNIGEPSISKYEETLGPFEIFCSGIGLTRVRAIGLTHVEKFRNSLTNSPLTTGKKAERLRTFFRYCEEREWCDKNSANKLKKPRVVAIQKIPFTAGEWKLIVAAFDQYPTKNSFGYNNQARIKAFVYTLHYSALRISDVVRLTQDRISDGRLFVRAAKNGSPIHVPLPPIALESLDAIKQNNKPLYFWSGNGLLKSAVADWQRTLIRLFKLAKVKGSAHQFRHMLAVDLLSKGVSIENVAAILGDTEAIVRKHYAPWVKCRQDALDAAVMSIW